MSNPKENTNKFKITKRFYRFLLIWFAFIPIIFFLIVVHNKTCEIQNFDYDTYQKDAGTDLNLTYNFLTERENLNTVYSPISIRYLLTMTAMCLKEYKNENNSKSEDVQSYFVNIFDQANDYGIKTLNTVFTSTLESKKFKNYIQSYFATELKPSLDFLRIVNIMILEDSLKSFSRSNYYMDHFINNNQTTRKQFIRSEEKNKQGGGDTLFKYNQFENYTAIEIEFERNSDLTIVIIKPAIGNTLNEVERLLRNISIHEISFQLQPKKVCVSLPPINISSIYNQYPMKVSLV